MNEHQHKLIEDAKSIVIVQAENPDGDSLGSALALEEIFGDMGKQVSLYAHVAMPKYLGYINGWDRVTPEFDTGADLAIIVDTVSDTLLSKALEIPAIRNFFETKPVIVLDHHASVESTLPFDHELIVDGAAVATGEMIYHLAQQYGWSLNPQAAENLMIAILADSLGLTTQTTTARSIHTVGSLVELGANPATIEGRRRERMKKPADILTYKGELLGRIEYYCEGQLAVVHIPWADIQEYSDRYNPSVLVLDEMRLVEGVDVAIALKTYPDGKLTGKIRSNQPVADVIAGYFGGGGHQYSSGFRIYEEYATALPEVIKATDKALRETA